MTMTLQFSDMTSSWNFFDVIFCLFSGLVTGPSFMSISSLVLELWQFSFIRDWHEIPKSGKTSVWVLQNIWRLEQVRNTKFGINVSNKMLLNAGKCQKYGFYCSLPTPQIRASSFNEFFVEINFVVAYEEIKMSV